MDQAGVPVSEVPLSDRKRLAHLVKSTSQHVPLIKLVNANGWKRGAEIGVLKGKTLFALLGNCPGLSMIGVDQWRTLPLRPSENAETYVDFDMESLAALVAATAENFGARCTIIREDSVAAALAVEDGSLDFVFIDGDHTADGVARDIRAWAPKVKPAGMVLGHDISWTTVRATVNRICPGWQGYGEEVWGSYRSDVLV